MSGVAPRLFGLRLGEGSSYFFFFFLILRRMGKNKALAHHTSTYFLANAAKRLTHG